MRGSDPPHQPSLQQQEKNKEIPKKPSTRSNGFNCDQRRSRRMAS